MLNFLNHIDRRWIFLLMGLAIALPVLLEVRFPEKETKLSKNVFDEIEKLAPGDKVLLAFDYDPASEGELGPMATAMTRHCAEKKLKLYFITLWPLGPKMIEKQIENVIVKDFPEYKYGINYINLGFKPGGEGVINVIVNDLKKFYTTDQKGIAIDEWPIMQGIRNIRQMDLICNVSAGSAGTKEWVQYAVTPFPKQIKLVAGCTGVQAPQLYPYIPKQLPGLLAAIKGAAEYEKMVNDKYDTENPHGKYLEAQRRMGPQLIAHLLMVGLIIVGNIIFFWNKKQEAKR